MIYYTSIAENPRLYLPAIFNNELTVLDSKRILVCPKWLGNIHLVPGKRFIIHAPFEKVARILTGAAHRKEMHLGMAFHCGFGSEVATGIFHPVEWDICEQLTESLAVFTNGPTYYFVDLDQRRVVKRTFKQNAKDNSDTVARWFAGGDGEPLYMYLQVHPKHAISVFNISEIMDSGEPDGELAPSHHIQLRDGTPCYDPMRHELWWLTPRLQSDSSAPLPKLSKLFSLPAEETMILPGYLHMNCMPDMYTSIRRMHGHVIIQTIYPGFIGKQGRSLDAVIRFRTVMVPHIATNGLLPSDIEVTDLTLTIPSSPNIEVQRSRQLLFSSAYKCRYIYLLQHNPFSGVRIYVADDPLEIISFFLKGPISKEVSVFNGELVHGCPHFPSRKLLEIADSIDYQIRELPWVDASYEGVKEGDWPIEIFRVSDNEVVKET